MVIVETSSSVKIAGYILAIGVFEYLSIEQLQIAILSILMLIDTTTGILKQFRLDKQDITSHKLWAGIVKKILTMMFLFSFALMFKGIGTDGTTYIKFVFSLLIMGEFYSITQNIYSYSTGKKIEEYDVISLIIKTIGDQFLDIIEKKLGKRK